MYKPNEYQQAIFDYMALLITHLVVIARAGTGKTTTIIESLQFIPDGLSIVIVAFNKSIQKEVEQRIAKLGLASKVDARTFHSLGFGCVRRQGKFQVDADRTKKIVKDYLKENSIFIKGRLAALMRLVGLAKNMLVDDQDNLISLAYEFGITDEHNPAKELAKQTIEILEVCRQMNGTIDFDDMIWLPTQHDLKPRPYDVVLVDEAQDLNVCQRWMVEQMLRKGGKLVAVGDDRQAIYRWRGAGEDVITELTQQFKANTLPLSITYRCPQKIVDIAKSIVPDYRAASTAPQGIVLQKTRAELETKAQPGDYILSRTNAPLVSTCLSLLSQGIATQVAGRDIGQQICTLAKKSECAEVADLMLWLDEYEVKERKRLLPDQEKAFELVCDKIACLKALCEGEDKVAAVTAKIERIFADTDSSKIVLCSTVHKAKGLERDRVWLLNSTFRNGQNTEEDNIYYVAITRTKKELIYIKD